MFQTSKFNKGFIAVIYNKLNEEKGSSRLYDIGYCYSMEISIDNDYQHKGLSRPLIKNLLETAKLDDNTLLCIDADGSDGFWEHIGFRNNRYGYDYDGKRQLVGKGYEKICTVRDIKKWIKTEKSKKSV